MDKNYNDNVSTNNILHILNMWRFETFRKRHAYSEIVIRNYEYDVMTQMNKNSIFLSQYCRQTEKE